jgi:hypothetical protein
MQQGGVAADVLRGVAAHGGRAQLHRGTGKVITACIFHVPMSWSEMVLDM